MRSRGVSGPWVAPALPGLLVLGAALVLAIFDGGFITSTWLPAAMGFLALAAVVLVVAPPQPGERSPLFDAALGLFAAFVAWNFLSLLWADSPGAAWEGADRALLYGIVLTVIGTRPWGPAGLRAAVGLVAFGGALLAAGVLFHVGTVDNPSSAFLEGRLARPIEYANANANLWLIGCFCAAGLATAPATAWPLRGLALGATCLLFQVALLSQSRGAAIGFALTALAFVALSPRRWIAVGALGLPIALTAMEFDTLTALRNAPTVPVLEAAISDVIAVIVRSALIAAAVGALAALAGRRTPARLSTPSARRAANLSVGALGVAALVAVLVAIGNPGQWLDDRWQDFKTTGYDRVESSSSRFSGSLGSDRYDFWRVSLNQFSDSPLLGAGAGNYAKDYLLDRESAEAPRHPHSLAFRLLGQNGLVGTLLFVAFLGAALGAVARARRRAGADAATLIVAAACGWFAWFTHGQGDWLWEFPALSILALGLLAVAARGRTEEVTGAAPHDEPRASAAARAGLIAIAVAMALSFAAPGIAARYTSAAYSDYREDPALALARLDRAAGFNPLSPEPLLARGVIARRLGDPQEALRSLDEAAEREPTNWFAYFELALAYSEAGDRDAALREARLAARLNPTQPLVSELVSRLGDGERVDAADLEARLYGQLAARLKPTQGE